MLLSARDILAAMLIDYQNNYLTVEVYAEHQGLTAEEANELLNLARKVCSHPHPDM